MMIATESHTHDPLEWNEALKSLPNPHLLQTWEWGESKSKYGWKPDRIIWRDGSGVAVAAAQILKRRSALGLNILYCPRGPILNWTHVDLITKVLEDIQQFTQQSNAIFLKIDPEVSAAEMLSPSGELTSISVGEQVTKLLSEIGFLPSVEQIQYRSTVRLNLHLPEEEILAQMKQKTRYNIRLASRKGVNVILGTQDDFELLYRMYAETSVRDNFAIREGAYYHDVWNAFHHAGMAQPFIAIVDGSPVAGLILFRYGETAWYLYGMSRDEHRNKMPNHLLQWEAIKWAKATGSKVYDFWGAPDELDPSDPMWGVYRFKAGFGATFVKTVGAWDFVARQGVYRFYSILVPKILDFLRVRGKKQTQRTLE
jgi:lipid II:glycine glycyltransferase (peptidoglycan interpeptide bridge formation enzyme)